MQPNCRFYVNFLFRVDLYFFFEILLTYPHFHMSISHSHREESSKCNKCEVSRVKNFLLYPRVMHLTFNYNIAKVNLTFSMWSSVLRYYSTFIIADIYYSRPVCNLLQSTYYRQDDCNWQFTALFSKRDSNIVSNLRHRFRFCEWYLISESDIKLIVAFSAGSNFYAIST